MTPETFRDRLNQIPNSWDRANYAVQRARAIMKLPRPNKQLDEFVKEIDGSICTPICRELFVLGASVEHVEPLLDLWYNPPFSNKNQVMDLVLLLSRLQDKRDSKVDVEIWDRWMSKAKKVWGDANTKPPDATTLQRLRSPLMGAFREMVQKKDWVMARLIMKHYPTRSTGLLALSLSTPLFEEMLPKASSLEDVELAIHKLLSTETKETLENQNQLQALLGVVQQTDPSRLEPFYVYAQAKNTLVYASMIEKIQPSSHPARLFEGMLKEGNLRAFDIKPEQVLGANDFEMLMKTILCKEDYAQRPSVFSEQFIQAFHERHQMRPYYTASVTHVLKASLHCRLNRQTATVKHLKHLLKQVDNETKKELLSQSCKQGVMDLPNVIIRHFPSVDPQVEDIHWMVKGEYEKLITSATRKALKKTVKKTPPQGPSVKRKM